MKLTSLVSHTCEVFSSILQTFPEGGSRSSAPPDALIAAFFRARKYLGSHDRRFIAETAYGTIRHLRRIDRLLAGAVLQQGAGRTPAGASDRVVMYLLAVDEAWTAERSEELRDAYQQEWKRARSGLEAHEQATSDQRAPLTAEGLADRYSFEPWMVEEFVRDHGLETAEDLCRCLNVQAPLTIRTNTLQTDRERLQAMLQASGIPSHPTRLSPLGLHLTKRLNVFHLDAFRKGFFELQDEGSQLLPLLIDPKPTAKVLDACAGAGGKTLELSALMKNRGEIVAADISARRLEELRKRARRAGAHNIRVRQADFTSDALEGAEGSFDVVLLDAPCSGTGTIRRNPGLKWTVTESSVEELVQKQSSLLARSALFVKPGGVVWYCTCSLLRRENEAVVEHFLSAGSSFALMDPASVLARLGLSDARAGSAIHLLPHRHGTDGFFCAALQRIA